MQKAQPAEKEEAMTMKIQSAKFRVRGSRFRFDTVAFVCSPLSLLALLALSGTGCQILTYTTPTGERFTRSSLGSTTSVSSLSVVTDPSGVRRVELRGYANDGTQVLGAVTEAAVRAAVESVK